MADNLYASLSEDGWVESPQSKLDGLITDFGYAEYSQSTLYLGEVASMPYIIKANQGDARATTHEIVRVLEKYLRRYYASASVESTVMEDPTSSMKVGVTLYLKVTTAQGEAITLGRLMQFENSKLMQYIRLSNG